MSRRILKLMTNLTPDPSSAPGVATARKPRRTRDPDAKRAAILEAATAAFAERGFARATIRDIAKRAGVTHGLVIRHFCSKEDLFLAAVPAEQEIEQDMAGDLEGLPARIARSWVTRMEKAGGADPFVAVVRSAASDEKSAEHLLRGMREHALAVYETIMDAPDTPQRVDLVGSYLIGITFTRYVAKTGAIAEMTAEDLVEYLTATLRAILLGPLKPGLPKAKRARRAVRAG